MDISLLRTFLEVSAAGSFGGAAERLFVTQSAVSLRIQRLEDEIGKPLFKRSKAGADLTPAGREFERYAQSILQTWEMARQQVAMPEGFTHSLTIGAQYSLWPRLGFRLIDGLRMELPDLSIRAELGMPDRLTRLMVEGTLQTALVYTPTLRHGLRAERVMDEDLILVAAWPDPTPELGARYVQVDWGPEVNTRIAAEMPDLGGSGLTLALGALAAEYIVRRGMAAYLPARSVLHHIQAGRLHRVRKAPILPFSIWSVWREDADPEIAAIARRILASLVSTLDHDIDTILEADGAASGRIQS